MMRLWIPLSFFIFYANPVYAYNVFKCKDGDGNVVFSQTRCIDTVSEKIIVQPASGEDNPDRRSLSMTERLHNSQYSKSRGSKNKSSSKVTTLAKPKPKTVPKNINKCTDQRDRILNIRSRMRAGYSSQQGENYRYQLEDAEKKVERYCN